MGRNGTVELINWQRGMVAIKTDDDGYTIIEQTDGSAIEVGDRFEWRNGYALGHEIFSNATRRSYIEVFVQNHSVSSSNLRDQLRY